MRIEPISSLPVTLLSSAGVCVLPSAEPDCALAYSDWACW